MMKFIADMGASPKTMRFFADLGYQPVHLHQECLDGLTAGYDELRAMFTCLTGLRRLYNT